MALRGREFCVGCFETQHRSSSLKRTWVTCKGNLPTSSGTYAGGAGICRSFLQGRSWWVPFFLALLPPSCPDDYGSSETPHFPTIISSPALVSHYGLALPNPPALAGAPSKQVSHYHTQQTASGETGIPLRMTIIHPLPEGDQPQMYWNPRRGRAIPPTSTPHYRHNQAS